jgi:hypothetical protein
MSGKCGARKNSIGKDNLIKKSSNLSSRISQANAIVILKLRKNDNKKLHVLTPVYNNSQNLISEQAQISS